MDLQLDKYKELFVLSKEAYAQEIGRIRRLEDKSAIFASFCGVLLALIGLTGERVFNPFPHPYVIFSWICLISYLLFLSFLSYAFFNLIRTLRISKIYTNPMNQETLDFFNSNIQIDIIYALTRNYITAIELNKREYAKKLENLKKSYVALIISMALIVLYILSFSIYKVFC